MSQAARDIIGTVGDLRNRCDLLLSHLKDVESQVTGYEQYNSRTEIDVAEATSRWGIAAGHQLDNAIANVDAMLRHLYAALEPRRR